MGRVITEAAMENMEDLWAVKRGLLQADQARRITITDALVDTGATLLSARAFSSICPRRVVTRTGIDARVSYRGSRLAAELWNQLSKAWPSAQTSA